MCRVDKELKLYNPGNESLLGPPFIVYYIFCCIPYAVKLLLNILLIFEDGIPSRYETICRSSHPPSHLRMKLVQPYNTQKLYFCFGQCTTLQILALISPTTPVAAGTFLCAFFVVFGRCSTSRAAELQKWLSEMQKIKVLLNSCGSAFELW